MVGPSPPETHMGKRGSAMDRKRYYITAFGHATEADISGEFDERPDLSGYQVVNIALQIPIPREAIEDAMRSALGQ